MEHQHAAVTSCENALYNQAIRKRNTTPQPKIYKSITIYVYIILNCWELVCISSNSSAENDNQPAKTFYDLYRISYLSPGSPKRLTVVNGIAVCESKPSSVSEGVDLSLFSRAIFSKAFLTAPALS